VYHSGRGYKKLFELRNEILPEEFRLNYQKKSPGYKRKGDDGGGKPYTDRVDVIPAALTPPTKLSLWENGERKDIPALAYAYKNGLGERVGYIMRGMDDNGEKIIRPLSVWLS